MYQRQLRSCPLVPHKQKGLRQSQAGNDNVDHRLLDLAQSCEQGHVQNPDQQEE